SLQPMQSRGSTIMRPNGAWSSSGAQYMQSATGQYSTHAGEPAQPVQHSLITARICGLRLRCVVVPVDLGSYLTTLPSLNSSMLGAPYATKNLPEIKCADSHILADRAGVVNQSAPRVSRSLIISRIAENSMSPFCDTMHLISCRLNISTEVW